MTQDFYDQLAPFYHLLYPNWEASVVRQSRGAAAVLTEFGVVPGSAVLDAACGIGTQAVGLAQLGYHITASDISAGAVARARAEIEARDLTADFAIADLRSLSDTFAASFDAVVALDNALPHLLSDNEIRTALAECRRVLRPGGVMLASVRDYAAIERRSPDVRPYGTRLVGDREYSAEQEWRWDGDQYDLTLRLTERERSPEASPVTHTFRTRYYAVTLTTLDGLMRDAGFGTVARRDEFFFQPLLVGINAPAR